jgi:WD40 repeat protein
VAGVAFTPDGRFALTTSNHQVHVWDGQTGHAFGAIATPNEPATDVVVAPDSRYGVGVGQALTARLRTLPDGQPMGRQLRHQEAILGAAFAPTSETLITVSRDRTARRWHVPTGFPVGRSLHGTERMLAVAFRPQGDVSVVVGWGGNAVLWETPPAEHGAPSRVQYDVEQRSGIQLLSDGTTVPLSAVEWLERTR